MFAAGVWEELTCEACLFRDAFMKGDVLDV